MDSRKLRYSLVMLMAIVAFGTIGRFETDANGSLIVSLIRAF